MRTHPTRYAILGATLSGAQRRLLRALPVNGCFDPDELPEFAGSLAALQRDGLIERARISGSTATWLRLTALGLRVREATEGMA